MQFNHNIAEGNGAEENDFTVIPTDSEGEQKEYAISKDSPAGEGLYTATE